MSTSITKSGILIADGVGIGENLVVNSNAYKFRGIYTAGLHWYGWGNVTVRSIELIDGKYWFHCKSVEPTKYGGFSQDQTNNGGMAIEPDTNYTVSGIWFASSNCNCRYWLHMRSTEGGANLSQMAKDFTVTTVPIRFLYTFNSGHNATYTINRFNLMLGPSYTTEGIDVYFTDIKMEKGSTPTPWLPNVQDDLYTSFEIGFDEESFEGNAKIASGYMQAREFYED